jgi:hypothetical protein
MSCLLLSGALALGGWGAGCEPVGSAAVVEEWLRLPSEPRYSYLFRNGVQVAAYDHERRIFRTYDAATDTWGPPSPPPWEAEPIPAPRPASIEHAPAKTVTNFGVDLDKLNGHREERYQINGKAASRSQARQALQDATIPDDAGRLRLTVIGEPASTQRVVGDLASAPALASWKERVVVQSYPANHWAVAQAGFYTAGKPTIYVQTPAGKVLHRQDDYSDGADGLATALRRADPNYDARKDPDLRQSPVPHLDLAKIPTSAWLLGAAALFLLISRKRS